MIPAQPKRSRRKRRKRSHFLRNLLLIILLAVLCVSGFRIGVDISAGSADADTVIVIAEGSDGTQIAEQLKEEDVIRYPLIYRLYNRIKGQSAYQMGEHVITAGSGYQAIYEELSTVASPVGVQMLIPEGYELRQIAAEAERLGLTTAESFLKEAQEGSFDYDFVPPAGTENRLEGYLFPATYTFHENMTAHEMIEAMLAKCDQVYSDQYRRRAEELSVTTAEVFTLASIIEREAAGTEDRDLVASVFSNRLKKKMLLESCATVQYILQERKAVLSTADTRIKSPYNTYLNAGLPPAPIASPGEASIRAALYPADSQYYYFVVGADGKHIFSRTYDEHLKAMETSGQ